MSKNYTQPTLEIIEIEIEDAVLQMSKDELFDSLLEGALNGNITIPFL